MFRIPSHRNLPSAQAPAGAVTHFQELSSAIEPSSIRVRPAVLGTQSMSQVFGKSHLAQARFDVTFERSTYEGHCNLQLKVSGSHPQSYQDSTNRAISMDVYFGSRRAQERFIQKIEKKAVSTTYIGSSSTVSVNALSLFYVMRKAGKYQQDQTVNATVEANAQDKAKDIMNENAGLIRNKGDLKLGDTENLISAKVMSRAIPAGAQEKKVSVSKRTGQWLMMRNSKLKDNMNNLRSAQNYAYLVQSEINTCMQALSELKSNKLQSTHESVKTLRESVNVASLKLKQKMKTAGKVQVLGTVISGCGLVVAGAVQLSTHPVVGVATAAAGTGMLLNASGQVFKMIEMTKSKHESLQLLGQFHAVTEGTWAQFTNTAEAGINTLLSALNSFTSFKATPVLSTNGASD